MQHNLSGRKAVKDDADSIKSGSFIAIEYRQIKERTLYRGWVEYMALFYCKECGKQISDHAKTCPNCGFPINVSEESPYEGTSFETSVSEPSDGLNTIPSTDYGMTPQPGFLNQENLVKTPVYKKPWFWIVIGILFLGMIASAGKKKDEDSGPENGIAVGYDSYQLSGKNYNDVETQLRNRGFTNITTEEVPDLIVGILAKENEVDEVSIGGKTSFKKKEKFKADEKIVIRYHTYPESSSQSVSRGGTQSNENAKTIGINEEFGNKTITGMVTEVNMDYKGYNPIGVSVPQGSKAILIVIKVTNISKESNYVSVGDFRCYADNISVSAELFGTDKYDYNNNIDPGRSALLGACYVVPENVSTIEMQYSPIGEKADKTIIKIK